MENIEAEIKKHFYELFPQNYSNLKIPIRYGIHDIAKRISICRCGNENTEIVHNIQKSLSTNFDITPNGASRKNFHFISRKYNNNQLFLEPRYFSLESAIELALAAGMNEDDFFSFCKIIVGFQWIYLRNTEYLIGLYSIRFDLQPNDYYDLKQYAKELKIKNQSPLQTQITVNFKSKFDEFQKDVADKYKYKIDAGEIKAKIMKFIENNIVLIREQDSRTLNDFLNECCVRFLEEKDFEKLKAETQMLKNISKINPPLTNNAAGNFKDMYNEFFDHIEQELIKKREPLKEELKGFLDENIANIQGKITRTLNAIRKTIDYPHDSSWLGTKKLIRTSSENTKNYDKYLDKYIIDVSLPWEYKKTNSDVTVDIKYSFDKKNINEMLNLDMSPNSIQNQINKYFIPVKELFPESWMEEALAERKRNVDLGRTNFTENFSFEKINMRRLRNDFVRIMIMDFTEKDDLEVINNRLKEHSFFTLRDDDPFDYLVISAIKIYKMKTKVKEYQDKEPYEILSKLFSVVKSGI